MIARKGCKKCSEMHFEPIRRTWSPKFPIFPIFPRAFEISWEPWLVHGCNGTFWYLVHRKPCFYTGHAHNRAGSFAISTQRRKIQRILLVGGISPLSSQAEKLDDFLHVNWLLVTSNLLSIIAPSQLYFLFVTASGTRAKQYID